MIPFSWSRWLRSFLRPQVQTFRKKPPRYGLSLEPLEKRLAPAQFVWSGQGGDNHWSTGKNWVGGVAPSGLTSALAPAGDDLIFGTNAAVADRNTVDDLSPPGGATFDSIQFQASGYTLSGLGSSTTITLGTTSLAGSGYISDNNGASNEKI